jgi:hypothetical protein
VANPKEELKLLGDHLAANPNRRLGPQPSRLVQCRKHEQFHPESECCPWCPAAVAIPVLELSEDLDAELDFAFGMWP